MSNPDVHVVIMVELEGRQWLVDVGYGAPFFEPLPRDLGVEFEISFGFCRYVLEPQDHRGRSRLRMYRGDNYTHGYLAKPEAREIGDFREIIEASYRETATFMNVVVVECFAPGRSVRFHNFTMTESTATSSNTSRFDDRDALVAALEEHCGFPSDAVRTAIEGLSLEADVYS
jgi:arylamine N-acetyltransferase